MRGTFRAVPERNDCEAQREGPEPRCKQDEPVHELRHAAFRRSYVEDDC